MVKLEYIEFRKNNGCSNYAVSILCIIIRLTCGIYTTESLFNWNHVDDTIYTTLAQLGYTITWMRIPYSYISTLMPSIKMSIQ